MRIKDSLLYAFGLAGAWMGSMIDVVHAEMSGPQVPITPVNTSGLDSRGIENLLNTFVGWIFNIAILLGIVWIIWGGLAFLFAGGDSEKSDKAKTRLLNGVIGLAVILGVYLIVRTVRSIVGNIGEGSF